MDSQRNIKWITTIEKEHIFFGNISPYVRIVLYESTSTIQLNLTAGCLEGIFL